MWSQLILILGMGGLLIYFLEGYGLRSIIIGIYLSIGAYLLGCLAPDFDHPKVHKSKWMTRHTKHRGHFHSLVAMCVFGILISLATYWFIHFWYFVTATGMFGFFTHLMLDQMRNIKTHGAKALKFW